MKVFIALLAVLLLWLGATVYFYPAGPEPQPLPRWLTVEHRTQTK